jgi:hypothetical protein
MTLKEFARKYEIPYSLVWEASYNVKPTATIQRSKDFPEFELYASIMKLLSRRALKKCEQVGKIIEQRQRIRSIYINRT